MPDPASRRAVLASAASGAVAGLAGCGAIRDALGGTSGSSSESSWPMSGTDPTNTARNDGVTLGELSDAWTFVPNEWGVTTPQPLVDDRGVYLRLVKEVDDGSDIGALVAITHDGTHRWTRDLEYAPRGTALADERLAVRGDERLNSLTTSDGTTGRLLDAVITDLPAAYPTRSELLVPVEGAVRRFRPTSDGSGDRYEAPDGITRLSRPATDGEVLVSASTDFSGQCHVLAFDFDSGSERWTVPREATDGAAVTLVGDQVLLLETSESGTTIRSLAVEDGSEYWRNTFESFPGYSYSPGNVAVLDETIAVAVTDRGQSPARGTIIGVDSPSGDERWRADVADGGYSWVTADAGRFYATAGCTVYGISPDGTVTLKQEVSDCDSLGTPIPAQDRLFVTGRDRLYAFA